MGEGLKRLLSSVAKIDVEHQGQKSRGTGFVVGDGLLLTALHVVGNRRSDPPTFASGPIVLQFGGQRVEDVEIDRERCDRRADWVLLRFRAPVDIPALTLSRLGPEDGDWRTFGFPDAQPVDGMVQTGTVTNPFATLEGVDAYQLFSKEAAAGDGAPSKGLSGGPVFVGDRVVGLLRFALMNQAKGTVAGTLYACPMASVADRCADLFEVEDAPGAAPADGQLEAAKDACALVRVGDAASTGYLVAPDRVATCSAALPPGSGVAATVRLRGRDYAGVVSARDEASDVAVVTLAEAVGDVHPLELRALGDRLVPWNGYGFPVQARGIGVPLDGIVMDPSASTPSGPAVLTLTTPQVPAAPAADLTGLTGAPVLVGGVAVGQISKYLGFGVLAAARAEDVQRLLQRPPTPAVESASAPASASRPVTPPPIGPNQYHVYVSFRAEDVAWAKELGDRLEGVGFRVFLEQNETATADRVAADLAAILPSCGAAVVIMSRAWVASPWQEEESEALLREATRRNAFRVVPVRIDDCVPPPAWDARVWVDCQGMDGPSGKALRRLQFALLDKVPPWEGTPDARLTGAEAEATDALHAAVRAAPSADRLMELWAEWRAAGLADRSAPLYLAEKLIGKGEPALALEVLADAGDGVRARQLRGLALGKADRVDEAIRLLRRLWDEGHFDAETGGILAGRHKQLWLERGASQDLETAFDIYRTTYERTGNTYPGINAAAMALQLGRRGDAERLAAAVIAAMEKLPADERDAWGHATLGEAHLLAGDLPAAQRAYQAAVDASRGDDGSVAVMRRQARLDLDGLRDALLATFRIPGVAAFTGHMTDAPGRAAPRFPEDKVGVVRHAIRDRLTAHQIGHGFSSLARGSDILFVQELLERGGNPTVILPFPAEDFFNTSVGEGWAAEYRALLDDDRVKSKLRVLLDEMPASEEEQNAAYDACNAAVHRAAREHARRLDEDPVLVTVWNGDPGDGPGGTADAVRAWQRAGLAVDRIDVSTL